MAAPTPVRPSPAPQGPASPLALAGRPRLVPHLFLGLCLALCLALLGGAAPSALAADAVQDLLADYQAFAGRRDDRAYAEKRAILERIVEVGGPKAPAALRRLLARHGGADARSDALVLGALVGAGGAEEIDEAVRWVESSRLPALVERLDGILAQARSPEARAHLRGDALRRATPPVKAQIARALGVLGDREALGPLLLLVRERDVRVRTEAIWALGAIGHPSAAGPLLVFLQDGDARVRGAAAHALGLLADRRAGEALARALGDADPQVVERAATALGQLEDPQAVPALIERLETALDDDLRVADAIARALHRISGKHLDVDVEAWRAWWETVKDRPWTRPPEEGPNTTITGARYYGFPVRSSKLVFVLDVSRSMGWNERLETAKTELVRTIESLPPATRFNVMTYSDVARPWRKGLVKASKAQVAQAVAFVRRQRPDNGTNSHHALALAFAEREADTIFFLSDGHPSVGTVIEPDLILDDVRAWNRWRRVHVHAVALIRGEPPPLFAGLEDPSRATSFMQRLAEETGGQFKLVR